MANAKELSDEYEPCEQCGDYIHAVPGMDEKVEVQEYHTDRYTTWSFCSMDCLKRWVKDDE